MIATYANISGIKPYYPGVDENLIAQFIAEVEQLDIKRLLGDEFYVAINADKSSYTDILEPKSYSYGGYNYSHKGLYYVIAYLVHARYVTEGDQKDTYTGYVIKNNDFSENLSYAAKKNIAKDMREVGFSYWNEIKDFIIRNSSDYPLFECDKNRKRRISRISRL